jgi:hypothetical protein
MAHSSLRLFCSGVPERITLLRQVTRRSFSLNCDRSFLRRCPSSTITAVHTYLRRKKFTSETRIS